MLRRWSLCGAWALLGTLMLFAAPVQSQDKKKKHDPNGEPKGFHAGESDRYAVWHGKKGWHLRTTTAKREHHFRGLIEIEGGTIDSIYSSHLEATGKLSDYWVVNTARNTIAFDFKTDKGIDGINFTVSSGAKAIRFNLLIDGKHHANRIFIGYNGHHPVSDPFILPAHPGKKK